MLFFLSFKPFHHFFLEVRATICMHGFPNPLLPDNIILLLPLTLTAPQTVMQLTPDHSPGCLVLWCPVSTLVQQHNIFLKKRLRPPLILIYHFFPIWPKYYFCRPFISTQRLPKLNQNPLDTKGYPNSDLGKYCFPSKWLNKCWWMYAWLTKKI